MIVNNASILFRKELPGTITGGKRKNSEEVRVDITDSQ